MSSQSSSQSLSQSSSQASQNDNLLLALPGEGRSEYRLRITRQQAELDARHREELDEQTSLHNAPNQRIGWWERLHHMRLPTDPEHPLVGVVAKQTELSLEQVRYEQQRRQAAASSEATPK